MNPDTTRHFPLDRDCLLPDLSRFLQLQDSWRHSAETLLAIRARLLAAELPNEIETIYVCGSMGRMEMIPASDCDLVVVTNNVEANSAQGNQIHARIWNAIEPLGLTRPKPDGIFSQVVSRKKLVSRETLGLVDEAQFVFGKRIQLLLDSQPVYANNRFESLTAEVLDRYRFANAILWNESIWSGLIAELTRYFGSLKVRTLWIPPEKPGRWRILNAKLRHSRLVLIAGLMFLLRHAIEADADSVDALLPWLKRTPLERIALTGSGDRKVEVVQLLSTYNSFLLTMNDPEVVSRLSDETLSHTEVDRELSRLTESANALRNSLIRLWSQPENSLLGLSLV